MNYKPVDKYGRIAVGQRVLYSAAILVPTNSAEPCGCRRDRVTGKIVHPDETVGFEVAGLVSQLIPTETGCAATVACDGGGKLNVQINHYGQGIGSFKNLRVLRDAPSQMEISA